jgi:isocitrate lyase
MQTKAKTNPATETWYHRPRFNGIRRLYTPEQVEEQRGSIAIDYTVAGDTAEAFHQLLRALFARREQITTF